MFLAQDSHKVAVKLLTGMKLSPGLTLTAHSSPKLNQTVAGRSPFGGNSSMIISILIKIIVDNVDRAYHQVIANTIKRRDCAWSHKQW